MSNLNEFSIATPFDFFAGLAGRSTIENLSLIFVVVLNIFLLLKYHGDLYRKKLRIVLRYNLEIFYK